MDNPVYQGGGPRPPRGTPPPIIIYDMQRNGTYVVKENPHEARERVRKRIKEEAKPEERRLDPYPQRQSVHEHDPGTLRWSRSL